MNSETIDVGQRGESLAGAYLEAEGWDIVARNVRFKIGELDLVVSKTVPRGHGSVTLIAFVEVKTRSAKYDPGASARAVSRSKRLKVVRAARVFLRRHPQGAFVSRFDVVTVDTSESPPSITHYPNAFDANGRVM